MAQAQVNPFFTPTQISGCQLWLDAADVNTISLTGTNVTQWRDKSGNGNNATTYLTNPGPTVRQNGLNNLSLLTFTSAQSQMLYVNKVFSMGTIFVVGRLITGGTNGGGPYYTGLPDSFFGSPFQGTFTAYVNIKTNNGYQIISAGGTSLNTFYLYGTTLSGSTATVFINGSTWASGTINGTPNASTGLLISADQGNPVPSQIGEFLFYSGISLNTSQRQQIEGYLAWKWGLQGSLPATHPYKSSPIPPLLSPPSTLPRGIQTNFFSPTQISGCYLWLDAADRNAFVFSGGSTSNIQRWLDKSTNGFHANASNNPTWSSSQTRVEFNGTTQYMSNTSYALNLSQRSMFIVMEEKTRNIVAGVFPQIPNPNNQDDYGALTGMSIETQNGLRFYWNNGGYSSDIGNSVLLPKAIYNNNMSGTSGSSFLNGSNTANANATGTGGTCSGYLIGQRWLSGLNLGYPLNAFLYEILVYSTPLTQVQRQQVEGYLAWKWGLQSSLPANHPYKTSLIPPLLNPPLSLPKGISANWIPTQISGCQFWLDATDPNGNGTPTTANQSISNWKDKSTNAYSATALVAATVAKRSINGKDSMYFNGTSTGYTYPSFTINTATHSFFYVARPTSVTANSGYNYILAFQDPTGGSPYLVFPYYNTGVSGMKGYITSFDGTPINFQNSTLIDNATANTVTMSAAIIQSGSQEIYRFGILQSSNNQSLTSTTSPYLYLGNYPTGQGYYFQGNLCEVLVYGITLTTSQRQQVEGYLAWKWGLVANLPANHPFKKWPPSP